MTSDEPAGRKAIHLDDVSAEMRAIAAEASQAEMARRFLAVLDTWAAPSAVLCLCKDATAESGWRIVSELTQGAVTPAFERSIVKLVEDSPPGSLTRPVSVRPRDEVSGTLKVRDNWLVPWALGETYGYLFLRGVAQSAPNLGEAVSLVAQPLWPHFVATVPPGAARASATSPARLAELLEQAQRVSDRLASALKEEREHLTEEAEELRQERPQLESRVHAAEEEREAARRQVEALEERVAGLEKQQADAEARATEAARERDSLRTEAEELRAKAAENGEAQAKEAASQEADAVLTAKVTDLEARIETAETEKSRLTTERDALRTELDAATKAAESRADVTAEVDDLKRQVEDLGDKLGQAEKERGDLLGERDAARTETESLKTRLAELEASKETTAPQDAVELKSKLEDLEGRLATAESERAAVASSEAAAREDLETLRAKLRAMEEEKPAESEPADGAALAEAQSRVASLEEERDKARAEVEELKARLASTGEGSDSSADGLQERITELESKLASATEEKAAAEAERDNARSEVQALRALVDSIEQQAQDSTPAAEERDRLKQEVTDLNSRLTTLEAERDKLKEAVEQSAPAAADAKALGEKLAQAEETVTSVTGERDALQSEAKELKIRLEDIERKLQQEKTRAEALERDGERAHGDLAEAEDALRQLTSEFDESRRQLAATEERASALESQKATIESDRDRAKAESNRLWQSVESLQRQLATETSRLAELANSPDQSGAQADELKARVGELEEREKAASGRWDRLVEAITPTAAALRRTPFVPPTLRVAFSSVEEILAAEGNLAGRPANRLARVLFLDRDTSSLDQLAGDLESGGIEVLVAHYPEEVGFFLKTPDARRLTAMVCDVKAFRGDQDLLELFRSWRQDAPNLSLLLSFKADNPGETEKAQRIPVVMTAGYLTRPFDRQAVIDAIGTIARRQGRGGDASPRTKSL